MIFHQHFKKSLFRWRPRRANARAKSLLTLMRLLFLTEITSVSLSEKMYLFSRFSFLTFEKEKITTVRSLNSRNKIKIFPLLSQLYNKYIFKAEKLKSTEREKKKTSQEKIIWNRRTRKANCLLFSVDCFVFSSLSFSRVAFFSCLEIHFRNSLQRASEH